MLQHASSLSPQQLSTTIGAALQAESALRNAGISDAAELRPLIEFAEAAESRESALSAHRKARSAHQRFAATHDSDDPAHEDHQRRVALTQAALTSAEQVLAIKLAEWRKARGL
jgi:hypothetical protein